MSYADVKENLSYTNQDPPQKVNYQEVKSELNSEPTEVLSNAIDAAIGSEVTAKGVDMAKKAVTNRYPISPYLAKAGQQIIGKAPGFLASQVAPRLAGAGAGLALSPAGAAIGFVAPELVMQGYGMLKDLPAGIGSPQDTQGMPAMNSIIRQNPELSGTPEVFKRAMQGPGVGYDPNPVMPRPANPLLSQLP